MASKKGFQLTLEDEDIVEFVYAYHEVTCEHLCLLTGRSLRVVNRRLLKLFEQGYIYRKKFLLDKYLPVTHQKYIYGVDRAATPILVERELGTKKEVEQQARQVRDVKALFIEHALMLTDIHVCLELASRRSPINLSRWTQTRKELKDSVTILEKGERKKLSVIPDAFLTLHDTRRPQGRNLADFFLEADRSREANTTTFQKKLKAFHAYFEQGLHTKKYEIKNASVFTVTLTKGRAVSLCEGARETLPRGDAKWYYFLPMQEFIFRVDGEFEHELREGNVSERLREVFVENGVSLSREGVCIVARKKGLEWRITDDDNRLEYAVEKKRVNQTRKYKLNVYLRHISFLYPEHIHDKILITPRDFDAGNRHSLIPPLVK